MNIKYWICPVCSKENIGDSVLSTFQCSKCGKDFKWNEISFFDKDEPNPGEYPYE